MTGHAWRVVRPVLLCRLAALPAAAAGTVAGGRPMARALVGWRASLLVRARQLLARARAALAARRRAARCRRACGGLWGEAADRARRALRAREQQTRGRRAPAGGLPRRHPGLAQRRGAAGCAGPHRVVQPDGGRSTSGSIPQRDLQQHIGNLVRDPDFSAFYHGAAATPTTSSSPAPRQHRRPAAAGCRCTCIPTARAGCCCCRATSRRWSRPRPCGATSWPTSRTRSARR